MMEKKMMQKGEKEGSWRCVLLLAEMKLTRTVWLGHSREFTEKRYSHAEETPESVTFWKDSEFKASDSKKKREILVLRRL